MLSFSFNPNWLVDGVSTCVRDRHLPPRYQTHDMMRQEFHTHHSGRPCSFSSLNTHPPPLSLASYDLTFFSHHLQRQIHPSIYLSQGHLTRPLSTQSVPYQLHFVSQKKHWTIVRLFLIHEGRKEGREEEESSRLMLMNIHAKQRGDGWILANE